MALTKNGNKEHGSIEVYFAKKLANNDKKVRDRAVKRIRSWLSGRPGDTFTDLDIMKLWKGLFYCMWFSDKPLVQEDLADSLSKLIHSMKDLSAAYKFCNCFLQTIGREWHGIDKLRLDKFYMLVRKVVKEMLEYIHQTRWNEDVLNKICEALLAGPCSVATKSFPDGIRMFVAEVLLDELQIVVGESHPPAAILSKLIDPFIVLSAQNESIIVFKSIEDELFKRLLSKEEGCKLSFDIDFETIGTRIFQEATKDKVSTKRRKKLLRYSNFFKEASKQKELDSTLQKQDASDQKKVKKEKKKAKKRKLEKSENQSKREKKGMKKVKVEDPGLQPKPSNDKSNKLNISTTDEAILEVSDEAAKKENTVVAKSSDTDMVSSDQQSETQDCIVKKLDFESSFTQDESSEGAQMDKSKKNQSAKKKKKSNRKSTSVEKNLTDTELNVSLDQAKDKAKTEDHGSSLNAGCQTSTKKDQSAKTRKAKTPISKKISSSPKGPVTRSSTKKKVVFELSRNAVTTISKLKVNPASVFTPEQKPVKSALKTSTPRRRASDFF